MARRPNILVIVSDQHSRDCSACYGHPVVRTPNLDALAERGVQFDRAYTTCPICVPARASLATGRYAFATGHYDNAAPYQGQPASWGHALRDAGYSTVSTGKLHFRSQDDDNGFDEEQDPLHVVDGIGDILSCIRDNPPQRDFRPAVEEAGPGNSTYISYDLNNTAAALDWIGKHREDEQPWVMFLSYASPHPPWITSPRDYARYADADFPMPAQWREEDWPQHPAIARFRKFFSWDRPFDEATVRKLNAAYLGQIDFLDRQIGAITAALNAYGLEDETMLMYSTDHGENRGARGMFHKMTFYEESVGIPLLMAGPGVPMGKRVDTPVSLIDIFPTVCDMAEIACPNDLPGRSLLDIAAEPDQQRIVFSEFHAVGSRNAAYMLSDGRFKLNTDIGEPHLLFDLQADPQELNDLASEPEHEASIRRLDSELREILNPEAVDAAAQASQAERLAAFGGREAALARGAFGNSPVPGEKPVFR